MKRASFLARIELTNRLVERAEELELPVDSLLTLRSERQPVGTDGNGFRLSEPSSRRRICERLPPVATTGSTMKAPSGARIAVTTWVAPQ